MPASSSNDQQLAQPFKKRANSRKPKIIASSVPGFEFQLDTLQSTEDDKIEHKMLLSKNHPG